MSVGKIIGTRTASFYKGSDGTKRLFSLRMEFNRVRTRNMYEKQRAFCSAIKGRWQRTLGK